MNLTPNELAAQYRRGIALLPDLHDYETSYGLPPFTMFAMWSRETNVDPDYLHGKTGDKGYGHGPFQLDNHPQNWSPQRQADCDAIDAGDMALASRLAAEELQATLARCRSIEGMFNAYNSGGCSASGTAGHDYGPDTEQRRKWLLANFGPPQPVISQRREDDEP